MTSCELWIAGRTQPPLPRDWLPPAEARRLAELRDPAARQASRTAQAVLRAVLSDRLGTVPARVPLVRHCRRCDSRQHGALLVPGSGLSVSAAHSGELVVVAVSDADAVGVDVELLPHAADPLPDALLSFALSAAERECLSGVPVGDRARVFRQWWTRKESLLKASGDGVVGAVGDLALTELAPGRFTGQWPIGPSGRHYWGADLTGIAGAVGSICLTAPATTMSAFDGDQAVREGLHRWEGSARVSDTDAGHWS